MSTMTHTVFFNKPLLFRNQQGVECYNITTRTASLSINSETSLPAKVITYRVQWTIDPQAGEQIEWRYNGRGSYKDTDHIPMGAQNLIMINCADI